MSPPSSRGRALRWALVLAAVANVLAVVTPEPLAAASTDLPPNHRPWSDDSRWSVEVLFYYSNPVDAARAPRETQYPDDDACNPKLNPKQRCFAVDGPGPNPPRRRVSRAGVGAQFGSTRNLNGRLGGRYLALPGPGRSGAYIEYADRRSALDVTPAGTDIGVAGGWYRGPTSPAARRAECVGFLGNIPNHPQIDNCLQNGPIAVTPPPMGWPAWLEFIHENYADEDSWVWHEGGPGDPYGRWSIQTSTFVTLYWTTATPSSSTPTTVPKPGAPGAPGGGGGGGSSPGGPGPTNPTNPGPVPADMVTVDVAGYRSAMASGSLQPARMHVTATPLTCGGGRPTPCGTPVPGAAGPLVNVPGASSGTYGPFPDTATLSALTLTPPPGYDEGGLYAGGEYRTTVPWNPGANLWAGGADVEHVFYQATPVGAPYAIDPGTPAAVIHWIDWRYDSRPTKTCPVPDTILKDKKGKVIARITNPPIPCEYRWFLVASTRYGYAPSQLRIQPTTTFTVGRAISRA